ncbi:MAG: hypothetical protein ABI591_06600 [Kofleriaceae bacterium]
MRWLVILCVACASAPAPKPVPKPGVAGPHTTSAGSSFIVPTGWTVADTGPMTVLTPRDAADSHVVLIESTSGDPDSARDDAWKLYRPDFKLPIAKTDEANGRNGWQQTRQYTYEPPPDADRTVVLTVAFASGHWTVAILDVSNAIMNLRTDDLSTIFDHLKPK